MSEERAVTFYFDFVSAYSWLAMEHAATFAAEHRIVWRMRPVLFAKILEHVGRRSAGQNSTERRYVALDVAREARSLGVEFRGPPEHPFRSLQALRVHVLHQDEPKAFELARAIARHGWSRGEDLTLAATIEAAVEGVGLATKDLLARSSATEIKDRLKANTQEAIDAGVFGVPSFVFAGELFWGQDRLPSLGRRLQGAAPPQDVPDLG